MAGLDWKQAYDAIVIGSGPNGLAAAITFAKAGFSTLVIEKNEQLGGGVRSAELTLPGFMHDTCSAVYPMAAISPLFKGLPLDQHGLEWIHPPVALAHPFDDGSAALLHQSVFKTAESLRGDLNKYSNFIEPFLAHPQDLFREVLQSPLHPPRRPFMMARFAKAALCSTVNLANATFQEKWAKGLFAGLGAHSILPLTQVPSAAIGLILNIAAHTNGWPIPKGGAQRLSNALVSYFRSLGGEAITGFPVTKISALPKAKVLLFDLTAQPFLKLAEPFITRRENKALHRLRHGPGIFKVDWALSDPIPWESEICRLAGTLHLGGTLEEITYSEECPWKNSCAEHPFVLLSQPTVFDPTRAPTGKHIAWSYIHVPAGFPFDMLHRVERQIERFAPGFKDTILKRTVTFPSDLEEGNPNYFQGDITGGACTLRQILFRPWAKPHPYATSVKGWYLCSSSTPPGPGVHGMSGFHAAKLALRKEFGYKLSEDL